ncbi:DUF937 domain-containing protein [Deinococcus hopiensis]|uniref:DUF937 domain-containing protein n=1 Tax=Deinococcus hopiensis KR-140 TaxID=695939 RepID=A0A1W1VL38_9DEIO|nr:DUF937 domain-containing protein [Deinococcus hopiensis]SMB94067.1 hypothetical protein SAMN00790413_02232 [Deinococcus hopiensis KR-140]
MMDLLNTLGGMGQASQTIGQQLGTSPAQTEAALEAAVPLLLGAMGRNAQDPMGAQSLAGALDQHDGSALDLFGQGQAPDPFAGQQILGHVFGGQQQSAVNAVSRRAGIDPGLALQILSMAAPLVLGYLSRRRQGGGMAGGMGGGVDMGSILGGILGGMGGGLGGMLGGGQHQPSQYQPPQYQPPQDGGLGGALGGSVLPGYVPDNQGDGRQGQGGAAGYGQPDSGDGGGLGGGPFGQPSSAGTGQMGGQMGGMIGTLNNVLDRDGDGNALNDLIGMFGGGRK